MSAPLIWTGLVLMTLLANHRTEPSETPLPAVTGTRGAEIYALRCAVCHEEDGRGVAPWSPPLRGSRWLLAATDEALIAVMLHGAFGNLDPGGRTFGVMPAMAWLSDEDLADAASHATRAFSRRPRNLSAAAVAAVRNRYANKPLPWSAAELRAMFGPPGKAPGSGRTSR